MPKDKTPIGEMDDVLDQIKAIEKAVKAQTLMKVLSSLKEYARDILELKEKTTALLEELGIPESDIKRIIDFVNNTPEVQLTDSDKNAIRKEVKETVKREKNTSRGEVEKKLSGVIGTNLYPSLFQYGQQTVPVSNGNGYNFTLTNTIGSGQISAVNTGTAIASASGMSHLTANAMNNLLKVADSLGDEIEIKL